MDIPILIIGFNRPETLKVLLLRLKTLGAKNLYFALDGPRKGTTSDLDLVLECKKIISELYNPSSENCLFQPANLGIRWGPPAAISWFFAQVEEGVILEDDCIPGDSFFPFVIWALERYRNVEQVKLISGFNRFQELPWKETHRFVKSAMIWGWASWRRAWLDYDPHFERWNSQKERQLLSKWLRDFPVKDYWKVAVEWVKIGKLKTWDVAWCWTVFNLQGLAVYPRVSLIQNIGFGENATNTFNGGLPEERGLVKAQSLEAPFREPKKLTPDKRLQRRIDKKEFWRTDRLLFTRIKKLLKSFLREINAR